MTVTQEWFSAAELSGLPGMPGTARGINKMGDRGELKRRKKSVGKGWEYHVDSLPLSTQAAVLKTATTAPQKSTEPREKAPHSYDKNSLWAHHDRATHSKKRQARHKLDLLLKVVSLVDAGETFERSAQAVAAPNGASWRTIQGWYHGTPSKPGVKHYDRSDWLAALVPGYAGGTRQAELSQEAWDFFRADYLRHEAPTAAACYGRLRRAATAHGWEIPSLRTIDRRIKAIPRTIRVLLREGEQGLLQLYPAQQRSVRELHALQWINGDGYQHNVFVRWPNGDIERPKTWFYQDVYSRMMLSYRVDVTENTDSIRLAFGDLVETYGIPEHATIDNTRAAANKWMTGGVKNRYRFTVREDDPLGLLPALGVQVHWTSVHNGKGHGQAKPVERAFGVGGIGEVVDKHPAFAGAYTGANPNAKPENYGKTAVPIEKFLDVLQQEITAWNDQEKRHTEICAGVQSFRQAFEQSYSRAPIRKATAEQRRLWLLSAEAIQVRNDGTVTLDAGSATGKGRNRYQAHELLDLAGHRVAVRFDPEDLHGEVYAYTLDGRYICTCQCIEATGFGNTEAARTYNRARKQFLRATKQAARAETRMEVMEAADQLPQIETPEPPEASVVRPLRPEPKLGRVYQPTPVDPAAHAALVASFEQQQRAEVLSLADDPRRVHAYWLRISERIEAGQKVSEEERQGWAIYRNSGQYQAQQDLFEAFGLEAGDFA